METPGEYPLNYPTNTSVNAGMTLTGPSAGTTGLAIEALRGPAHDLRDTIAGLTKMLPEPILASAGRRL